MRVNNKFKVDEEFNMKDLFTIDKVDEDTYIISEYRHWEETHCYLLNGTGRSLLIDTGLGICNISEIVRNLTDKPVRPLLRIFTGIISEDINIILIFMYTRKNSIDLMAAFRSRWK